MRVTSCLFLFFLISTGNPTSRSRSDTYVDTYREGSALPTYGNGSVYQRKDGRWIAKVYIDGKAVTRYAKSEKEAYERLSELWQSVGKSPAPIPSVSVLPEPVGRHEPIPTVSDFVEMWLRGAGLKPLAEISYRSTLRSHVLPVLGEKPIDRVTPADVAAVIGRIIESGRSAQTARNAYGVTSRMLQVACDWFPDAIPNNPAKRVSPPRRNPPERRVWTQEQAAAFIAYCEKGDGKWDDLFLVALLSGLRLGELLGLAWEDVNWQEGTISVKRTLADLRHGRYELTKPKSAASIRVVTLPKSALRVLGIRHKEAEIAPLRGHAEARYVFRLLSPVTHTNGITENIIPREYALNRALHAMCKRVGLPPMTPHGLRHMHISLLAHAGVPVKAIQQRVGHSSPTITLNIYTHTLGDADRHAAKALDAILGKGEPEPKRASRETMRQVGRIHYGRGKKRKETE